MSVLFNHAIRYEWLEQERNPILLVRQSAKRQKIPEDLDAEELRTLLPQLERRFRVMVFLDAVTGLRRIEFLDLKWRNNDFGDSQINVRHSIYLNVVGNCKTETSRKPVPMDPILASELWTVKWLDEHPADFLTASKFLWHSNPNTLFKIYGRNYDESYGVQRMEEWLDEKAPLAASAPKELK